MRGNDLGGKVADQRSKQVVDMFAQSYEVAKLNEREPVSAGVSESQWR